MKGWYLIIDVERCENCNNCFLSCRDEHVDNNWPGYAAPQPAHGQKWIRIEGKERGQFPLVDVGYLPLPCMHCDDAPCVKAARDGAIYKRPDGVAIIDPVKAKGQRNLLNACPYGAIGWSEESDTAQKCTFCAHLLDEGWEKTRCVQACPTGALSGFHGEESEMKGLIEAGKLEVYRSDYKTNPRVYYKNLYRFTRCFIAGSVALEVDGKEECAEGARVTLLNGAGETVAEGVADNFGDYKFDGLEENSGTYTIRVEQPSYETKTVAVALTTSLSIGTTFLKRGR